MKTKIRQGVFETNSSSSHSIVIEPIYGSTIIGADNFKSSINLKPDENGVLHVYGCGEYGWEEEQYNDTVTKLDYLHVDQRLHNYKERADLVRQAIELVTGITKVEFHTPTGSIDHQSYGTAAECLRSIETVIDYLFNPKSLLITDNDNH